MFDSRFSDELKQKLARLYKKDRPRYIQVIKKIEEIVSSNSETINHYKNLGNVMSDKKRVHIGENFVLTFRVNNKENIILFVDFDHRDNIYDN